MRRCNQGIKVHRHQMLYVGVLGPLEVRVGAQTIDVTTGRLRTLLVALAMSAGRAVGVERLAAALWGENRPTDHRRSLRTYVTRLRHVLGGEAIQTVNRGYLLATDNVDALRFIRLLDAAETLDGVPERICLMDALALWRGTPFEGVRAGTLEQDEAPQLISRYLRAVERRIDLDLAAGRHHEVVDELRGLTGRFPLHEPLWTSLMIALYHSGRQSEALEAYQRLYRVLADELGVRPGPAVDGLHRRILLGDPQPLPRPGAVDIRPPWHLPVDIGWFARRSEILAHLDGLLLGATGATVTALIAGGPGMGKTALAVHWAHRVAGDFPDGQLYVNLRGFPLTRPALQPMEGLHNLLTALGVPSIRIPMDLPARIGLYRSLLAGRRVLVVLDDARDAEQVRPLLPGAAGCAAVVTGRAPLPALVAEGADLVDLGPPSTAEH
jgi:DNA-binding SARP family transcriptional activator